MNAFIKNQLKDKAVKILLGFISLAFTILMFLLGGYVGTERSNAANEEWKKGVEARFTRDEITISKKVSIEIFDKVIEANNTAHNKIENGQTSTNGRIDAVITTQNETNNLLHEVIGELKNKK